MAMHSSDGSSALALRILSVALGIFFLFMGLDKLAWLGDSSLLGKQLYEWMGNAPAPSRWYMQTIAIPGAPFFARLVPAGELAVGAALLAGCQVRLAALVGLFMVLNFHFAMGVLLQYSYLWNGYGPPVLGGLLALGIGGGRLPFSLPSGQSAPSAAIARRFKRSSLSRIALALVGWLALVGGAPRAQAPPDTAPPSRADLLKAAREVMQKARYCTLITLGDDGHPQARILDPFAPEEDFTVWLGTNPATRKVREIARDPRVTLLYFDLEGRSYVTLLGRATIVTDPDEKARHWKQEWAAFYPDGARGDGYTTIRVRPTRLEIVSYAHGLLGDEKNWRPLTVELDDAGS